MLGVGGSLGHGARCGWQSAEIPTSHLAAPRLPRRQLQFAVINEKHDQLVLPKKLTWKFKTINTFAMEEEMGLRSQWDITST